MKPVPVRYHSLSNPCYKKKPRTSLRAFNVDDPNEFLLRRTGICIFNHPYYEPLQKYTLLIVHKIFLMLVVVVRLKFGRRVIDDHSFLVDVSSFLSFWLGAVGIFGGGAVASTFVVVLFPLPSSQLPCTIPFVVAGSSS